MKGQADRPIPAGGRGATPGHRRRRRRTRRYSHCRCSPRPRAPSGLRTRAPCEPSGLPVPPPSVALLPASDSRPSVARSKRARGVPGGAVGQGVTAPLDGVGAPDTTSCRDSSPGSSAPGQPWCVRQGRRALERPSVASADRRGGARRALPAWCRRGPVSLRAPFQKPLREAHNGSRSSGLDPRCRRSARRYRPWLGGGQHRDREIRRRLDASVCPSTTARRSDHQRRRMTSHQAQSATSDPEGEPQPDDQRTASGVGPGVAGPRRRISHPDRSRTRPEDASRRAASAPPEPGRRCACPSTVTGSPRRYAGTLPPLALGAKCCVMPHRFPPNGLRDQIGCTFCSAAEPAVGALRRLQPGELSAEMGQLNTEGPALSA